MAGRALRFAAIAILGVLLPALSAQAQNLEAGKPPGQIFSNTCSACHKSVRGVLRTVSPGSLPSFLREHYTTSADMAKTLSAFVLANGATDTRFANAPVNRQGRPEAQPGNPQGSVQASVSAEPSQRGLRRRQQQEATRPDPDGLPQSESKPRAVQQAARTPPGATPEGASPSSPEGRNVKRGAEPPTPEAQAAALAAREQAPKAAGSSEAAISAAVPLPESADLPPPAIGDFQVPSEAETKPAETEPANSAVAAPAPSAVVAAPSPPPPAQQQPPRSSSASLQLGGPPAPPISH